MAVAREYRHVRLDTNLIREVASLAAESGRSEDEIIEEALRGYLEARNVALAREGLRSYLDEQASRASDQGSEEETARVVYDELHTMRRERREVRS